LSMITHVVKGGIVRALQLPDRLEHHWVPVPMPNRKANVLHRCSV
jgi:hypothetical protein